MTQNTILHSSTPTISIISKYAIFVAPEWEQNYYSKVAGGIQTQYTNITLTVLDCVYSGPNSNIYLFSVLIPVLFDRAIEFLGIMNQETNTVDFDGDNYYGYIIFESSKNANFVLKTGNGLQIFKSRLLKYN